MFSTRLTGVTSSRTDTGTVVSTHGKTKPREFGVIYTNPVISQAALIEVSFLSKWKMMHFFALPYRITLVALLYFDKMPKC